MTTRIPRNGASPAVADSRGIVSADSVTQKLTLRLSALLGELGLRLMALAVLYRGALPPNL